MTKVAKKSNKVELNLRDRALAFAQGDVDAMIIKLNESLDRRDAFEVAQGAQIGGSWSRERDRMRKSQVAVARLFLALNIEPSAVIERSLNSGSMFNAKALKKIVELAQFVSGAASRLEKVTSAFIMCAVVATEKGETVITNAVNRKFLNSTDFTKVTRDAELLAFVESNRHKSMTTGDATQSSQARNVLEALGCGVIHSVDKPRDAIALNLDSDLIAYFKAQKMTV